MAQEFKLTDGEWTKVAAGKRLTGKAKEQWGRRGVALVQVIGLEEVRAKLKGMPLKMQKKLYKSAMRKATRVVLNKMKQLVPVDSGLLRESLKIRSAKRRNKNMLVFRAVTDPKILGKEARNPHWFEYGAPGHLYFGHGVSPLPPQPFARPAADQTRPVVEQVFRTEVQKAVNEMCQEST